MPWRKKEQRGLDFWFWEVELGKVSKTLQQVFIAAVNLFSDFDRSPPDPQERQVSSRHWKQEVVL